MIDARNAKPTPGPRGLDLLKTVVSYYRDPLAALANAARQYGDVVLLKVGPYAVYQVVQPEHIKYVLQDNNHNYRMSGVFGQTRPVVGRGLSTNEGESWLLHRRMMQPLFGRGQAAAFAPRITRATTAMLDRWRTAAGTGRPIALYPELLALNHHILGEMLFDADVTGQDAPVLDALRFVRDYTNRRINALVSVPTGWPTPRNRRFWASVARLDTFAYERIRRARETDRAGDSLLALLLRARDDKTGAGFSDEELHDELMTLFFAAYEDPANALAWSLALLTHHPDADARLRDEIEAVLGGRAPTYDDLANLTYTGAVVDETLRLYPPTWSILRDVVADDVIGGCPVAAGSSVLVNIHLAHRLPEYWDAPDTFNPERFLPEPSAGRPRYAFLPFGGGPRQCIAAALATVQVKLMLALLVGAYRFAWASAYPLRPNASHSLRPPRDIAVRVHRL